MFLICAIKPIVEKIFLRDCLGEVVESVQNKTIFVSLRCRFSKRIRISYYALNVYKFE